MDAALKYSILGLAVRAPIALGRVVVYRNGVAYYERRATVQRAMGRTMYGNGWSRKNALGERRVILAATPAMMREIQRRYYVPNNTALIVAGDVTPERAIALARAVFGADLSADERVKLKARVEAYLGSLRTLAAEFVQVVRNRDGDIVELIPTIAGG